MRRAVIDLGTNTILMLIADFDENMQSIKPIIDIQRIPRLGKGVDNNRNILPESTQKAISILNEYRQIILANGSENITAAATSFIRDSHNKNEFIKEIKINTGIDIEVLSGEDEAKWTFVGGIYDKLTNINDRLRMTTIDIGGGSTEITTGEIPPRFTTNSLNNIKISGQSFDIGSVRLKEKYFSSHPPSNDETKLAEDFIFNHLNQFDKSDKSEIILILLITHY